MDVHLHASSRVLSRMSRFKYKQTWFTAFVVFLVAVLIVAVTVPFVVISVHSSETELDVRHLVLPFLSRLHSLLGVVEFSRCPTRQQLADMRHARYGTATIEFWVLRRKTRRSKFV